MRWISPVGAAPYLTEFKRSTLMPDGDRPDVWVQREVGLNAGRRSPYLALRKELDHARISKKTARLSGVCRHRHDRCRFGHRTKKFDRPSSSTTDFCPADCYGFTTAGAVGNHAYRQHRLRLE